MIPLCDSVGVFCCNLISASAGGRSKSVKGDLKMWSVITVILCFPFQQGVTLIPSVNGPPSKSYGERALWPGLTWSDSVINLSFTKLTGEGCTHALLSCPLYVVLPNYSYIHLTNKTNWNGCQLSSNKLVHLKVVSYQMMCLQWWVAKMKSKKKKNKFVKMM